MKRLAAAVAIAAGVMFTTKGALAEPAARLVYLRGKGTETCADEGDLRAAVRTRLGYDPFNSYAASTMFAEVAVADGGFSATLKLVDADNSVRGDRVLKAAACAELTGAMALTISLAIDPMSVTRNGPPPDAPPEERSVDTARETKAEPQQPPVESTTEESPADVRPKRPRPIFMISLGPYASLGSAPALSFGGALAADARYGFLLAGLEGRAELPASASESPLGRVSSHMYAGSIYAGARQGMFFAAVIVSVGSTLATSTETASSRDESALWLAAGLRLGVAIPLSDRFELRIRGDMLGNAKRTTLTISGQKAYEYPAVSGDLGIVFGVRFP